jgi:hypothetical protein
MSWEDAAVAAAAAKTKLMKVELCNVINEWEKL